MSDLPKGWESTTLNSCFSLVKDKVSPEEIEDTPYLGLEHIESGTGRLKGTGKSSDVKSSKTQFQKGDVLYGKLRPYLSKVYNPDFGGICSTDILALRPTSATQSWIFRRLKCDDLTEYSNANSSGVNLPRTSFKTLAAFPILLPPLNEQKRIVAKLDACQGHIDRSIDSLDSLPKLLEDYRASLLASAFRGDLTAKWREQQKAKGIQHESAQDLLTRLRQERRHQWEQTELQKYEAKGKTPPKNWQKKYKEPKELPTSRSVYLQTPLEWILSVSSGKGLTAKNMTSGDISVYGGNGVTGYHNEYTIEEPTVIIGRVGFYCGSVHLTKPKSWVTDNALIVSPLCSSLTSQKYLLYSLRYANLGLLSKSTAQPVVSGAKIYSHPLSFPPYAEQKEIVILLEAAFARIDAIKLLHSKLEIQHSSLTQSLLAKAFRGDLVPQDPNDEPAEVLLARIKEEASAAPKAKKAIRKKAVKSPTNTRITRIENKMKEPKSYVFDLILKHFKYTPFTFEQLQEKVTDLDYDNLQEALFKILQPSTGPMLQMEFNSEEEVMEFTLTKK